MAKDSAPARNIELAVLGRVELARGPRYVILSGVSEQYTRLVVRAAMLLREGNLAECDRMYCAALCELRQSPYHQVMDLQFSNSPSLLAAHFDDCFSRQPRRFRIGAAYTEMNGFDINTDRWYGDIFLYQSYGGHADYNWLAFPDVGINNPDFTLKGMESLQEVFASMAGLDRFGRPTYPEAEDVRAICGLVVVARFQKLINRAAEHMKRLSFPLLSTAHDYDLIAEVVPSRPSL